MATDRDLELTTVEQVDRRIASVRGGRPSTAWIAGTVLSFAIFAFMLVVVIGSGGEPIFIVILLALAIPGLGMPWATISGEVDRHRRIVRLRVIRDMIAARELAKD